MAKPVSSSPDHQTGIWLSLETILTLPLEPSALATVWREILCHQTSETEPGHQYIREQLHASLHELEINHALESCRRGEWLSALNQLENAAQTCDFRNTLAPRLLELLPRLHHQLIDLAEELPSRCPFSDAERAELLWSSYQWIQRLNAHQVEQPERMLIISEQIYRYGALAWMNISGPLAEARSLELLLALSAINSEATSWTLPACRNYLVRQLEATEELLLSTESTRHILLSIDQLSCSLEQFHKVFSRQPGNAIGNIGSRLNQQLADIKACLKIWQLLRFD